MNCYFIKCQSCIISWNCGEFDFHKSLKTGSFGLNAHNLVYVLEIMYILIQLLLALNSHVRMCH